LFRDDIELACAGRPPQAKRAGRRCNKISTKHTLTTIAPFMKLLILLSAVLLPLHAWQNQAVNPEGGSPMGLGRDQREAIRVNEAIYQAIGFGNTYLVTTPQGNVVIDTSAPEPARRHVKLLKAVSQAPVKYIVLTHGHGDHTGGIPLWKEPATEVIAQRQH